MFCSSPVGLARHFLMGKRGGAAPAEGKLVAKQSISAALGVLKYAKSLVEKGSTDPMAVRRAKVLEMYEALPKFSEKKQETMQRFISDKTCQWWEETRTVESKAEITETNQCVGTGSKQQPQLCSFDFAQTTNFHAEVGCREEAQHGSG